jgi:CRP-like cAMP-binding protein
MGEMAVVNAEPRIATVVAAGETKTLRIARADFESILRDRPETALGVIRVLSTRLREATLTR